MTHFLIWILGHLLPQEDSTVVGQHPIYIFVVVPPHCIVDERGKSFRRVDLCFKRPFLCLSGTDAVASKGMLDDQTNLVKLVNKVATKMLSA